MGKAKEPEEKKWTPGAAEGASAHLELRSEGRVHGGLLGVLPCLLSVVAPSLAGCKAQDPMFMQDIPASPQDEPAGAQHELMARIEVSPSHFVDFYELAPGQIAIFEQGLLDRDDEPLDRQAWVGLSMTELHELLAPSVPVPARLRLTDQHREASMGSMARLPREASRLYVVQEPASLAPQPESASDAVGGGLTAKGAETSALASELGTRDAAWQDSFCSSFQVDEVWCPMNKAWAHSGWRRTMYYDAAGIAASSIAGATFWVDMYTTGWNRIFTRELPPGGWGRWSMNEEGAFRSGVDGREPERRVHFAEQFRLAITYFEHHGYHPDEAEWQFNNDIQGVTHDDGNWYFTRTIYTLLGNPKRGAVAKAAVTDDLNREPSIRYQEPDAMVDAGYRHFGDLTHRNGLLYIAMDGNGKGGVAVWSTDIKYYIGWVDLPGLSSCPWIAYNPRDGLFYVPDGTKILRKYSIRVYGNTVTATEVPPLITLSTEITSQQGGEFSSRGILYLARGYKSNPMAVYGVDVYNGMVYLRAAYSGTPASDWEGEGVTIWDLSAGQAPGIRGHMHFQLLDNDWDNDDFSFAHLIATNPAHL